MKIAIMGAMHEEVASIVAAMSIDREETIGSRTYFSGQLCDQEIVVAFSHSLPGNASTPISLNTNTGLDPISFMNGKGTPTSVARANVLSQILSLPNDNPLQQQAALASMRGISSADEIIDALGTSDTLQTSYNTSSKLAKQLRMVA